MLRVLCSCRMHTWSSARPDVSRHSHALALNVICVNEPNVKRVWKGTFTFGSLRFARGPLLMCYILLVSCIFNLGVWGE